MARTNVLPPVVGSQDLDAEVLLDPADNFSAIPERQMRVLWVRDPAQ